MVKGEDGGQDRRVLALSVDAVPHDVHIGQDPVVQGPESGGRSRRGEKELPKKGKMAGMGREVDI